MAVDILFEVLGYLTAIVDVITFIITGVTFGGIPLPNRYNNEFEEARLDFIVRVTRGYATIGITYFSVQAFFALYFGYYDVFVFVFSFFGWTAVIATMVALSKLPDDKDSDEAVSCMLRYHQCLTALAVVIVIKLCHTTYHCTDLTLRGVRDDTYNFLMLSFIFELILMMFCSLIPYLHVVEKKGMFHIFNMWGLEVIDLLAQVVVIQTYCRLNPANEWSGVLLGYYILFAINALLLMVVSHFMLLSKMWGEKLKRFIVAHEIMMDSVTDIPFFILSVQGKTYVGNIFITLDMVLKGIVFVRGLVWVPNKIGKDIDLVPGHHAGHGTNTTLKPNPNPGGGSRINQTPDTSKCVKFTSVTMFTMLTGGIIFGLYYYLGWSVDQYNISLIRYPSMEPTMFPTLEPTTYAPTAPTWQPTLPTLAPSVAPTVPTSVPTTQPTFNPTDFPSHNDLRDIGWALDLDELLNKCEGDCDNDLDCRGNYVCYEQTAKNTPPGCTGKVDITDYDYCVDPADVPDPSPSPTQSPTNISGAEQNCCLNMLMLILFLISYLYIC